MTKKPETTVATYRLQLIKDFNFTDAAGIVPYVKKLGVDMIYLSPVIESAAGSMHGYDGIDPGRISTERGGREGFEQLDKITHASGMQTLLDIVPNHLAATTENLQFSDILANGRQSRYWHIYDMHVPEGQKIHLPILGKKLSEVLADGGLSIGVDKAGKPQLCHYDQCFPLKPDTIASLQKDYAGSGKSDFAGWVKSLQPENILTVLNAQNYELVYWQDSTVTLSWRRFFDVNGLIGVREEDDEVCQDIHKFLFEVTDKMDSFHGYRVDHIDGLRKPKPYLSWLAGHGKPVYVEKILAADEKLRSDWPIEGTTGYEFIHRLNQVLVDRNGFHTIENFWRKQVEPRWQNVHECAIQAKQQIINLLFPAELKRICDLSADDDAGREAAALFWTAITVGLSVYRTYGEDGPLDAQDRLWIDKACVRARELYGEAFDTAAAHFLPALIDPQTDKQFQVRYEWQQLSGPAMAKSLEDTTFYRYTPLLALNEVGCEIAVGENGQAEFFDWMNDIARHWPATLKASSTHDTKRSEDARARLTALSGMADDWIEFYKDAVEVNKCLKSDAAVPGPRVEYFLYQTLLATWPLDGVIDDVYCKRITAFLMKSMRESKLETSWTEPDEAYEKMVLDFAVALLRHKPFLDKAVPFVERLSQAGAVTSLIAQTIKILSPGVPDIYQGTEVFDFSLVDPDNRRLVDYARLQSLQDANLSLDDMVKNWKDGGIKQWLTSMLLTLRRDVIIPMGQLQMKPLVVEGRDAVHLIAYRLSPTEHDNEGVIVFLNSRATLVSGFDIDVSVDMKNFITSASVFDVLRNTDVDGHKFFCAAPDLRDFPISVIRYKHKKT